MDKIAKALQKLTAKEQAVIKQLLTKIISRQFEGLNLLKLRGQKDIYRARKGNLRVIYRQVGKDIFVLAIERRSEKTYRDF